MSDLDSGSDVGSVRQVFEQWQKLRNHISTEKYYEKTGEEKENETRLGYDSEGKSVPVVVFGMVHLKKTEIRANISGLRLEAKVHDVISSSTHRQQLRELSRESSSQASRNSSVTMQVGGASMRLLETTDDKSARNPKTSLTVLKLDVDKSFGLLSSQFKWDDGDRKNKDGGNNALVTIGTISIDIPAHPIALHGMASCIYWVLVYFLLFWFISLFIFILIITADAGPG